MVTDKLWALAFGAVLLIFGPGAMFVAAAYVTPALLGTPNSAPRQGLQTLAEGAILFGGLFLGMAVAFGIMIVAARCFMTAETYNRWQKQDEDPDLPRIHKVFSVFFLRAIRPLRKPDDAL